MNLGTEYRRIWTGNAASNLADGVIFVGIPLLALTLTHKPLAIAGLDISYTVPRILAGGLLFAIAAFLPMGINVLAFGVAGLSYFSLRGSYAVPVSGTRPRRTIYADIKDGVIWLRRNQIILRLTVIGAIASIGYMIPFSYLVLYTNRVLGLNAVGYGLLLSVSAVGGLLGSWVAGRLRSRIGYGWSIVAALTLGTVAFVVVSVTTNVVVVAVALAAYICHAVVWNVLSSSVRQQIVPAEFMGRVGSVSRLLGLIGLAAGALAGGWLAGTFGLRIPFAVAAVLFVIASLLCVVTMGHFRIWEARQTMDAA